MTFVDGVTDRTDRELDDWARVLSALGHPIRLRIVRGLIRGECCVGNMVDGLDLPQPLVSRHLAVLRDAGIVSVERQGRKRCYRVCHPCAGDLVRCLESKATATSGRNRAAS